nr:hypothetical protein CFP56_16278 [Quercus suber]
MATTTTTSIASSSSKPHAPSHDPCWYPIQHGISKNATLGIGSGDIGSVYLVVIVVVVKDKKELVSRNKDTWQG